MGIDLMPLEVRCQIPNRTRPGMKISSWRSYAMVGGRVTVAKVPTSLANVPWLEAVFSWDHVKLRCGLNNGVEFPKNIVPRGDVVLIAGGREFKDRASGFQVLDALDEISPIRVIVTGKARGADAMGEDWALNNDRCVYEFLVDWAGMGAKAGPKRNRQMLVEGQPDLVVAFPGNYGTRDMVAQSRSACVPTIKFV